MSKCIAMVVVIVCMLLAALVLPLKADEVRYNPPYSPSELYELLYPYNETSISLPTFLESLPSTPAGRELITRMVAVLQNLTGTNFPPELLNLIFNNTFILLNYTTVTIRQISDIWYSANLAYWNGELNQINTSFPRIPTGYGGFVFPNDVNGASVNMSYWIPSLEYLGDDLFWGFILPPTTSKAQAKINTVAALILNQLSDNIHLNESDPNWTIVRYKNQNYTSVSEFLMGLLQDGWNIECFLEWHVAQFFGIYSNATTPQDKSGTLKSVADPIMLLTGVYNQNRTIQAVLPAAHSEWMCSISNPQTNYKIDLEWYEGDYNFGFVPGEMYLSTEWGGRKTAWNLSGKQAITAMQYMSFVQEVFVAAAEDLFDGGYGITGVCDDSCAMVELMLGEETVLYPFLLEKNYVIPEIKKRIAEGGVNAPIYSMILDAVNNVPVDWEGVNDSTVRRAGDSVVWPKGKEPWQCVVEARKILGV